jgi:hypothetical protein
MTAVNCPMCELRFATKNERDWHLRNEHEHLHVHPPRDRRVEWPRYDAPSRVDESRRDAQSDGAQHGARGN